MFNRYLTSLPKQTPSDPASNPTAETSVAMPPQDPVTSEADNNNSGVPPVSRELEMLNEEIRQLMQEKIKLEGEVNQEEASMKLKESEIKSFINETETLHQMTKQLTAQKVCLFFTLPCSLIMKGLIDRKRHVRDWTTWDFK